MIIVGHDRYKQGARNYLGESEYNFNMRIASHIKNFIVGTYDNHSLDSLARTVSYAKTNGCLMLHFNWFGGEAHGCELVALEHSKHDVHLRAFIANCSK